MSDKTGRFGDYAVLVPITHKFEKSPKLTWTFTLPASRHELVMTTFATTESNFVGPNGETIKRFPHIIEICWREISTLFGGSNLPTSEISPEDMEKCETQEDVDKLLAALPRLSAGATIDQVEALLGAMPHAMVSELWAALGAANPGWGPRKNTTEKK